MYLSPNNRTGAHLMRLLFNQSCRYSIRPSLLCVYTLRITFFSCSFFYTFVFVARAICCTRLYSESKLFVVSISLTLYLFLVLLHAAYDIVECWWFSKQKKILLLYKEMKNNKGNVIKIVGIYNKRSICVETRLTSSTDRSPHKHTQSEETLLNISLETWAFLSVLFFGKFFLMKFWTLCA